MKNENVKDFLKRGGKIKKLPPQEEPEEVEKIKKSPPYQCSRGRVIKRNYPEGFFG